MKLNKLFLSCSVAASLLFTATLFASSGEVELSGGGEGGGGTVSGTGTDRAFAIFDGAADIMACPNSSCSAEGDATFSGTSTTGVGKFTATIVDTITDSQGFRSISNYTTTTNQSVKHSGGQFQANYSSNDTLSATAKPGLLGLEVLSTNAEAGTVAYAVGLKSSVQILKTADNTFSSSVEANTTLGISSTATEVSALNMTVSGAAGITDLYAFSFDDEFEQGSFHLHVRNNDASGDKSRWINMSAADDGLIMPGSIPLNLGVLESSTGVGSDVNIYAGDGASAGGGGDGANVNITSGAGQGSADNDGGDINLSPALGVNGGVQGGLIIQGGAGGSHFGSDQNTAPTYDLSGSALNNGACTGAAASINAASSDMNGILTLTACVGGAGPTVGKAVQVNFNEPYKSAPKTVILTAATPAASNIPFYVGSASTTGFQIWVNSAPSVGASLSYYYLVIQ